MTTFKLTLTGGSTRRLSFADQPSWALLSERISTLFSLPSDKLAVAYLDAEDDWITLSSDEELRDYFLNAYQPGELVKFTVEDLRAPRGHRSSPPTPPAANFRNTFGGSLSEGLPFNIDEDWQHFPSGIGGLFSANGDREGSSLHAFVEEIESGASTISNNQHDETTSVSDSDSHASTVLPPRVDKGKGKAREMDASSTASLVEEKIFEKPDIHVYDVNKTTDNRSRSSRRSSVSPFGTEATPKAHVQEVPPSFTPPNRSVPPSRPTSVALTAAVPPSRPISVAPTAESIPPSTIPVLQSENEPEDPPLPALDSASLEHANASLSIDIANLLSSLATAVSTHPELSEGFRNILRNAAAGTYWTTQRDAMSQAADIARSVTEELRRADQEAGRRVSDALGLLFRTISQSVGTIPTATTGAPSPPSQSSNPAPGDTHGPWGRGGPWRGQWGPRNFFGGPSFGGYGMPPSFGRPGGYPFPPPPPPPNFAGGPPHHHFAAGPPPPPPAGPHGGHGGRRQSFDRRRSWVDPPTMDSERQQRQSSTELRNQVEAAKLLYKAEKERYRQNREERRKEKTRRMLELMGLLSARRLSPMKLQRPHPAAPAPADPPSTNTNPAPQQARSMRAGPAHIVSNARGSFPQFEMIGVPSPGAGSGAGPRRSHTLPGHVHGRGYGHGHHGHGGRRHTDSEDPATRAVNRINRKLADMGFSETAHPDLPSKIRASIPEDGVVTRDKEDDIVTSLLEELVIRTKSPAAGPVASGSRQ
ncbi:hypothetical protein BT96DRAFT_920801 [Gymnopus androsaceus JB14]|uniref:PB1 domain-containing protein n=1 Tax=Gymnopus androsaceus JB14 TaxID=1447944 RepID=A0A6A4HNT7_9AGAR|nr:hypothetical protein BT96DRAFT_920801 [Gymnopus androsaceus JB14]